MGNTDQAQYGFVARIELDVQSRDMLDLQSLHLFVRASELGSLSRAAQASNMALAAVSRRIALLEAFYGVELLKRGGRGVAPTPAGTVLLERARNIIQQISLAEADLSDYAKGLRGTVRLLASTSALTQFLPEDLAQFSEQCPDIRVIVREAYTSDIAAAVRSGDADIGIAMGDRSVEGLTLQAYRRDRLAVVAPMSFRPGLTRVSFADLIGEDFVVMEDNTATTRLLTSVAADQGLALRLRVKVNSFDAVCRMIQSGFGIGILPVGVAEVLVRPMDLRFLELDEVWAERQMLICTGPQAKPNISAVRLAEFLTARGGR